MTHKIKIKYKYYRDVLNGDKTFEIRKNDRDYKVGDIIHFVPVADDNSDLIICNNQNEYKITYVFHGGEYGLEEGYCVFGIAPIIEIVNQVEEEFNQSLANNNQTLTNDGWIPCSERLPERGTAVLVQDDENLMDIAIFKKEYGVDGFELQDFWVSANNFIAWCPLPDPYKGE